MDEALNKGIITSEICGNLFKPNTHVCLHFMHYPECIKIYKIHPKDQLSPEMDVSQRELARLLTNTLGHM